MVNYVWFLIALILMSYPIAELTRYIWVNFIVREAITYPVSHYCSELLLMWIAYIIGIFIIAWRLQPPREKR